MTDLSSATPSESPITLNVKTIESHTHTVSVRVSETVLQLKERLADMLQVPTPRQRLIFRGRVMVDDKSLSEYSLEDGHTIHLVTRPAEIPPSQQQDAPRTRTGSTAGTGPHRSDTRDITFSIFSVDDNMDTQNLLQALAGTLPLDMEFDGPPELIINADPSSFRSVFGSGTTSRLRAMPATGRSVPLGASLPHLATIDAELTRASAQLRNVQTILAHPADQLDRIQLESLEVPEPEPVDEEVDGDSIDLTRMGNFLSQLSAISRSMANDLQSLSDQYQQAVMQPAENNNLQRISLRAARAMHRLASVQNTVFPMLANASFVGTSPGPVSYRYQPTRLTAAQPEILSTPNPATMGGARTHGHHRAPLLRGLPLPPLPRGPGVIGLIPSIVAAHARASAQSVNAAFAAASANAGSRSGPGQPSSSSTTPSPATSTPSTAPTPSSTLPFNIPAPSSTGPNVGSGHPGPYTTRNTARSNNGLPPYAITNPFAVHHDQSAAARIFIPDFTAGIVDIWRSFPGSMSSSESGGSSSTSPTSTEATSMGATDSAATRAVQGAFEQLDQALTPLLSSRRRVRPEDFSTGPDDRSVLRRRLGVHPTSSTADLRRLRQELDQLMSAGLPGSTVAPSAPALTPRPAPPVSITSSSTQTSSRSGIGRSSSGDSRRPQTSGSSADAPPPAPPAASSTSPGSPSTSSSSSNNSSNNNASPAYNLGRIGVFISAILRMVDQPREDGSPRTLADVICNDPESPSTPLQELVRNLAEAVTVRETRLIVEGFPAPLRNLHPVLNTFIREQALNGQQLTETNLDYVADLFSRAIMDAVHAGDILETLTPPASIQISAEDIRNISLGVLREHFRRLIYLVVAAPTGRENNWPTFARDMILWIRDVVGAWRVAFYGLFQERDQPEAQRIATHVVGSAIHANGRRWVELSNRATNTMVNVLCANIVPRRRGEEQAGGLVGGAWPLMATSRPNAPRSRICHAPSLLGSTAPPAPLGPLTPSTMARAFGSASFTESSGSRNAAAAAVSSLETQMLSENLARRISELITPSGSSSSSSSSDNATTESLATTTLSIQEAILAELEALRSASTSSSTIPITSTTATTSAAATASSPTLTGNSTSTDESESASTSGRHSKSRRTRVEEVEDEEKP